MYNNQRFVTFFCAVERMIDICLMKTESLIIRGNQLLLLTLFVVFSFVANCQREEIVTIPWGTPKLYTGGGALIKVPFIEGQSLDGYCPNFGWKKPVPPNSN